MSWTTDVILTLAKDPDCFSPRRLGICWLTGSSCERRQSTLFSQKPHVTESNHVVIQTCEKPPLQIAGCCIDAMSGAVETVCSIGIIVPAEHCRMFRLDRISFKVGVLAFGLNRKTQ